MKIKANADLHCRYRSTAAALLLLATASCDRAAQPLNKLEVERRRDAEIAAQIAPDWRERRADAAGGETPVSDKEAAKLSTEFGLVGCSGVTRLRNTSAEGYLVRSWRVRGGARCFDGWADRQGRYSIFLHLDKSQSERDRLPWLCSETGAHVAECVSQGTTPSLLIRRPRFADHIVLHRITKVAS
jgi:hypothetical protein